LERTETETKIVVDTNVLISALINPESLIWFILELKTFEFLVPEFFLLELEKYSQYIKEKLQNRQSKKSFDYLISELSRNILLIPEEIYLDMLPSAFELMKNIDEKDSPFLALAMKLKCSVLSNDEHFKKQNLVKCYNIEEFVHEFISL